MASIVKSETMKPPPSGTMMARVMRQNLPQVVSFAFLDFFMILIPFMLILL